MPKSASRPAKTETQAGAPPASACHRLLDLLGGEDRGQVDLDAVRDSVRTASNSGSLRVVVTGSFT